MAIPLFIATAAAVLAAPPTPYEQEITAATRTTFQANRAEGPDRLLAALDALARDGDASAAEIAGELVYQGALGIARDPRKACDYFALAAPHRPDSAHNYASCFYAGDGRAQDMAAAREWYGRASEGGWVKAHCAFGNMLIDGRGGAADVAGGLALCEMAANLGDPDAQADFAGHLLLGKVVEKDAVASRLWLEKASAQGHVNAAFVLAEIYLNGDGTPRNPVLAASLARRAHDGGRPDAALLVTKALIAGMIVEGGTAPRIDRSLLPEAIAWAELAAERDPEPARREEAAGLLADLRRLQSAGSYD